MKAWNTLHNLCLALSWEFLQKSNSNQLKTKKGIYHFMWLNCVLNPVASINSSQHCPCLYVLTLFPSICFIVKYAFPTQWVRMPPDNTKRIFYQCSNPSGKGMCLSQEFQIKISNWLRLSFSELAALNGLFFPKCVSYWLARHGSHAQPWIQGVSSVLWVTVTKNEG